MAARKTNPRAAEAGGDMPLAAAADPELATVPSPFAAMVARLDNLLLRRTCLCDLGQVSQGAGAVAAKTWPDDAERWEAGCQGEIDALVAALIQAEPASLPEAVLQLTLIGTNAETALDMAEEIEAGRCTPRLARDVLADLRAINAALDSAMPLLLAAHGGGWSRDVIAAYAGRLSEVTHSDRHGPPLREVAMRSEKARGETPQPAVQEAAE